MKLLHRFTYGAGDPVESRCRECANGGAWKLKVGAPEMKKGRSGWKPELEHGATWDGMSKGDPAAHVVVLNPALWSTPILLVDTFIHEVFHVLEHTEHCRGTRGWKKAIPHPIITRLASAFAKFLHENDLEIVKRRRVVVEAQPFLERPDDSVPHA